MIIRKPYAFLIKHFKKIHIILLVLGIFVAYKLIKISGFVNEFMRLATYDSYSDPITRYITFFTTISVFILFVGSVGLLFLLRHKKKPWKIYLFPVIEYFALLLVLSMIKSFFLNYTTEVATADLRLYRDFLMMFLIGQIPVLGIFIIRGIGLDIKKFNFTNDEEFLELKEEDREEIEIGLNIDKHSFIRFFKKILRNINYFYIEHTRICNVILGIFVVILGLSIYKSVYITHKSYRQGDFYFVDGYTFRINKTYFTDKDYTGNVVSDKSNFVIVDLTIVNNSAPRTIYLENFHIRNGNKDFTTTNKTFSKEFQDLGSTYESIRELKRDERLDCIIVYKVDNNLRKNRFVLYYQEKGGYLRKIKLRTTDLSKISEPIEKGLEDEIELGFRNNTDTISFDYVNFKDSATYTIKKCNTNGCKSKEENISVGGDYKLLEIEFGSDVWEAKNMIDFLKNYGKLIYKDSEGEEETIDIENPIKKSYYGKSVFIKVPVELESAKKVSLDLIVRNKHYVYKLI